MRSEKICLSLLCQVVKVKKLENEGSEAQSSLQYNFSPVSGIHSCGLVFEYRQEESSLAHYTDTKKKKNKLNKLHCVKKLLT